MVFCLLLSSLPQQAFSPESQPQTGNRVLSYEYGKSFFILSLSLGDTNPAVLSALVLFDDFPVNRWLLYPFLLFIFPDALSLNLFAAPRCVFSFGIMLLPKKIVWKQAVDSHAHPAIYSLAEILYYSSII